MYRDLVLGIHSHVMYLMNGITIVNMLNMFINLMVQDQKVGNSIMKHIYIVGQIINYSVLLIMIQLLIKSGGRQILHLILL
jgi:hypothetical protein